MPPIEWENFPFGALYICTCVHQKDSSYEMRYNCPIWLANYITILIMPAQKEENQNHWWINKNNICQKCLTNNFPGQNYDYVNINMWYKRNLMVPTPFLLMQWILQWYLHSEFKNFASTMDLPFRNQKFTSAMEIYCLIMRLPVRV